VIVGGVLICVSFLLAVFLNHSASERRAAPKSVAPGSPVAAAPVVAAPAPLNANGANAAEPPAELRPAELAFPELQNSQMNLGSGGSECREASHAPEPADAALVEERCSIRQP